MANQDVIIAQLNNIDTSISDFLAQVASISIKLNVDISNGAGEYGNDSTAAHIRAIRDDLPIQANVLKVAQDKFSQLKVAIQ